ncbi:hypothetical protein F1C58_15255 [Glaciihabitans sp. INWT7]|uniref:hypothetical protein n=1 Tax=Glaciihabitans sp. INWT7 TaxID=2596912 RepID=UPI001624A434|nr:hypothetical protein [Glaciihabitans sp. INWT7]QNE48120.1 hypothetical protein F1C58_15255 [Glaciihabitans sp. INWT7]
MATSLTILLRLVAALNDPEEPYRFEVQGETIVGTWDVRRAAVEDVPDLGTVDWDYRLSVRLDENKSTYEFTEHRGAGVVTATRAAPAPVHSHSYPTSRITDPLFTFLEGNGYSRKKAFLRRLLSR